VAPFRAVGLMSGTSLDGVDVAMLDTDGETIADFGPTLYRPYSETECELLRDSLVDAQVLTDRAARTPLLRQAEDLVTRAHGEAVEQFIADNALRRETIDVIGFHGQTVLHRPERKLTIQIGDGEALAARLGRPVVYDFRAADVAAGGQGAPLVPVFHRALAQALRRPHPIAILNIGGVANVTVIDGVPEPFACDTGPGNALIDDFMRARTGATRDAEGATAAAGKVDEEAVFAVLRHPFFALAPPKSLDRNDFRQWVADVARLEEMTTQAGAATLTAISAASIAAILHHLPQPPRTWIVAGGGTGNTTLMRMLAQRLAPATIEAASAVGWNSDALEAQAFAYLAVRRLRGLPITFPGTTGIARPAIGGVIAGATRLATRLSA
jgi:anhydro-N-acetylmuramic acid kinase